MRKASTTTFLTCNFQSAYTSIPSYFLCLTLISGRARQGYEETPDNFRIKDRKDNTILCFKCGLSSNGKRELVNCDYCILSWHLDCLNPPMASAPNKKATNGKARQAWICPNHVDQSLANTKAADPHSRTRSLRISSAAQPEEDSRVFRTRKPKEAKVVEIGLKRGFRNNGII